MGEKFTSKINAKQLARLETLFCAGASTTLSEYGSEGSAQSAGSGSGGASEESDEGGLEMDDFIRVFKEVLFGMSEEESLSEERERHLRHLFMKIDANSDGSVSWEEFTDYLLSEDQADSAEGTVGGGDSSSSAKGCGASGSDRGGGEVIGPEVYTHNPALSDLLAQMHLVGMDNTTANTTYFHSATVNAVCPVWSGSADNGSVSASAAKSLAKGKRSRLFSDDGANKRRVMYATVSRDSTVRIWDSQSLRVRKVLCNVPNSWISDCCFLPNSKQLVTLNLNGVVNFYDAGANFSKLSSQITNVPYIFDSKSVELRALATGMSKFKVRKEEHKWLLDSGPISCHGCANPNAGKEYLTIGTESGKVYFYSLNLPDWHFCNGNQSFTPNQSQSVCDPSLMTGAISGKSQSGGNNGGLRRGRFGDFSTTTEYPRLRCSHTDPRRDGVALTTLEVHSDWVTQCQFLPESNSLITSSLDCEVKFSDVERRKKTRVYTGHSKGVYSFAYSRDFKIVASAGIERRIDIFDPYRCMRLLSLNGHSTGVSKICLNSNRHELVSLGFDRTVKIWDLRTYRCVQTIQEPQHHNATAETNRFSSVCIDEQNSAIVVGSNRLDVWTEAQKAKKSIRSHECSISKVAFNGSFAQVLSADVVGNVNVWDMDTSFKVSSYRVDPGSLNTRVTALAMDTSQRRLITGTDSGVLRVWNFSSGQTLCKFVDTGKKREDQPQSPKSSMRSSRAQTARHSATVAASASSSRNNRSSESGGISHRTPRGSARMLRTAPPKDAAHWQHRRNESVNIARMKKTEEICRLSRVSAVGAEIVGIAYVMEAEWWTVDEVGLWLNEFIEQSEESDLMIELSQKKQSLLDRIKEAQFDGEWLMKAPIEVLKSEFGRELGSDLGHRLADVFRDTDKWIITLGIDGKLKVWLDDGDVSEQEPSQVFEFSDNSNTTSAVPTCLCLISSSVAVTGDSEGSLYVFDFMQGLDNEDDTNSNFPTTALNSVCPSPNRKVKGVPPKLKLDANGRPIVPDTDEPQFVFKTTMKVAAGYKSAVNQLVFLKKQSTLVSAHKDGCLIFWRRRSILDCYSEHSAGLHSDEQSESEDIALYQWDCVGIRPTLHNDADGGIIAACFSGFNGRWLITGDSKGRICVFDCAKLNQSEGFSSVSPSNSPKLLDWRSMIPVYTCFEVYGSVTSIDFSSSLEVILVATQSGKLCVWTLDGIRLGMFGQMSQDPITEEWTPVQWSICTTETCQFSLNDPQPQSSDWMSEGDEKFAAQNQGSDGKAATTATSEEEESSDPSSSSNGARIQDVTAEQSYQMVVGILAKQNRRRLSEKPAGSGALSERSAMMVSSNMKLLQQQQQQQNLKYKQDLQSGGLLTDRSSRDDEVLAAYAVDFEPMSKAILRENKRQKKKYLMKTSSFLDSRLKVYDPCEVPDENPFS